MIRDRKNKQEQDVELFDEDYFVDDEIDDDYWLDDEEEESDEDESDDELEDEESEEDESEDDYDENEGNESEEEYDESEEEYDDSDDEEEESDEESEEYDNVEDDIIMKTEQNGKESKKANNPVKGTKKTTSKNKKKGTKKAGFICLGVAAVLGAGYVGVSCYFMNHFYFNTKINGQNFSCKTVENVEQYIIDKVDGYQLDIIDKDNNSYIISGDSIDLVYNESDELEASLKKQNAFAWPKGLFKTSSFETDISVTYDEDKLNTQLRDLDVLKIEQVEPVSAHPVFDGEKFVVEPEVVGTTVDMEKFESAIHEDVINFETELKMSDHGCYKLPKYVKDSPEVQAACDTMNTYLNASITYSMDEPVVVDKSAISNWLSVDDDMNVIFDENAVREWLRAFGERYDTVGTTRTITTPWGKTTEVSGGTYGWGVDEDTEFGALVNSIKNGEVITKDPAYCVGQTAASHGPQDWGTTYAEVDLSAQHMWYIENGNVVVESDVVTGVPIPEKETTAGVFSILEKASPKTLVGAIQPDTGKPEYETPVTYWMRITWSGIGFHDATWQPAFGGSLYSEGRGSHGCVNMPYDAAGALYNAMPEGTPVVVHY